MKDFLRQEPLFSLCGLNCGLCTMHLGGHCPGCGGGAGNQSCSLAHTACNIFTGKFAFFKNNLILVSVTRTFRIRKKSSDNKTTVYDSRII